MAPCSHTVETCRRSWVQGICQLQHWDRAGCRLCLHTVFELPRYHAPSPGTARNGILGISGILGSAQKTASSALVCFLRSDDPQAVGNFWWTPVLRALAAPRPSPASPSLCRRNPFLCARKRALYHRTDPRFFAGLRAAPHCLDICALSMQFCSLSVLRAKP